MSVFESGLPKKSDYRRFKISEDKNDDFAAMREVINRRYKKLLEKKHKILIFDNLSTIGGIKYINKKMTTITSNNKKLEELMWIIDQDIPMPEGLSPERDKFEVFLKTYSLISFYKF